MPARKRILIKFENSWHSLIFSERKKNLTDIRKVWLRVADETLGPFMAIRDTRRVSYEDHTHTYDVEQVDYLIKIPSAIKGLMLKTPLSKLIEEV